MLFPPGPETAPFVLEKQTCLLLFFFFCLWVSKAILGRVAREEHRKEFSLRPLQAESTRGIPDLGKLGSLSFGFPHSTNPARPQHAVHPRGKEYTFPENTNRKSFPQHAAHPPPRGDGVHLPRKKKKTRREVTVGLLAPVLYKALGSLLQVQASPHSGRPLRSTIPWESPKILIG